MLELGEDLLDGVEVGRVFGQEEELGTGAANGPADGLATVAAEIVDDDDIAGRKGRNEDLFDIGEETLAVDRTVEEPWRIDAVMAESREEGQCFPAALRNAGWEPSAAGGPAPERRHIGLGPSLIDEHQPGGIDPRLIFAPLLTSARDVGSLALSGDDAFF